MRRPELGESRRFAPGLVRSLPGNAEDEIGRDARNPGRNGGSERGEAALGVVETPEQIKRRDAAWVANPRDPLRQAIVQAPCSVKVRELVKEDPLVVEALVMNDRGTLVCSMAETTDYWQGDEPKWQRTFVDGKDAFVEDPAFDVSTGKYAIQVSVPMAEGAKRIGAVTLTLKLKGQEAAAAPKN